ncbi:MAG: hypothetical protein SGBAC_002819 [Bacillariaceae sp.]
MMKSILCLFLTIYAAAAFNVHSAPRVRSTALFMSDSQTGTVKWFNTMKGFGFIVPDGDGPDVFVHQTEIKADGFRSLADGEAVEYVPEVDDNGRTKATRVTGPGGSNVQGAPFRPESDFD